VPSFKAGMELDPLVVLISFFLILIEIHGKLKIGLIELSSVILEMVLLIL
jgi:hypothetical protein